MTEAIPEAVLNEIQAALERDPWVDQHEFPVKVWAAEHHIVLDGQVEHIAAKRAAGNAARRVVGGRWPVLDLLRVVAEAREDEALRDEVVRTLSQEPVFRNYTMTAEAGGQRDLIHNADNEEGRLEVKVDNGSVTLAGHAWSLTHRRLAEVLTWWTSGCQRVENQIEIIPPEDDNDNELSDAVRIVLEKDPLVHAGQIKVGAAAGVVELDGSVASDEERQLAVLDAWYVPGVSNVDDRIDVRLGDRAASEERPEP